MGIADVLPAWVYDPIASLFAAGGLATQSIFVAALVLWTLALERLWYFARELPREREALRLDWDARSDRHSWRARAIRAAMISEIRVAMTGPLPLIRVMVPICPLLGLLGTVFGMLAVFDSMAMLGVADARSLAEGVSRAMVSTMAGLAVSLNALFFVTRFTERVRIEEEHLADALHDR